jgi:hypothetical protein
VDEEDHERRKGELEEAWKSHRMPQLLKRPDTQNIALLTSVAFCLSSGGEVQGVEWMGYCAKADLLGAAILVQEYPLQHTLRVSSASTASFVDYGHIRQRLGSRFEYDLNVIYGF